MDAIALDPCFGKPARTFLIAAASCWSTASSSPREDLPRSKIPLPARWVSVAAAEAGPLDADLKTSLDDLTKDWRAVDAER